jgi:hypothetical protein
MKAKSLLPVIFILTSLLFISCQTENKILISDSGIVGEWEWIRTDGGFAYHIHETPASTNENIEWVFTDKKRYSIYINGTLTSEGTYSLTKRSCIHSQEDKSWIDFSSSSDQDMMIEKIDAEILELSDESYDGIGSQFKRKGAIPK